MLDDSGKICTTEMTSRGERGKTHYVPRVGNRPFEVMNFFYFKIAVQSSLDHCKKDNLPTF